MSDGPADGQPENNVYTILVILATVLVAGATVFLAMRSQHLFGSWNPFGGTEVGGVTPRCRRMAERNLP